MKYLTCSSATRANLDVCKHSDGGVMLSPSSSKPTILERTGCLWAADNECFNQGDNFDLETYLDWLVKMRPWRDRCLFATAPDVVGDARRTWMRSREVLPQIRTLGFLAALVAQDGIDLLTVPWLQFDVLFIGGSTDWKLSEPAFALVREAKRRGKWVHMGRVNSLRRFNAALMAGCDSVDGTYTAFGPDLNAPKLMGWMDAQHLAPLLPLQWLDG